MTSKTSMIKRLQKAPDKYASLCTDVRLGKRSATGAFKLLREGQKQERVQFIKENKAPETWTDEERMLVNKLRIRPYDVWSSTLSDKELMSNILCFFTKPGDKVVGMTRQYNNTLAESCEILEGEYHRVDTS